MFKILWVVTVMSYVGQYIYEEQIIISMYILLLRKQIRALLARRPASDRSQSQRPFKQTMHGKIQCSKPRHIGFQIQRPYERITNVHVQTSCLSRFAARALFRELSLMVHNVIVHRKMCGICAAASGGSIIIYNQHIYFVILCVDTELKCRFFLLRN